MFEFSTASSVAPTLGFECELRSSENATDVAALHAFEPCESPRQYTGLPDGAFVFSVGILGEELAESAAFAVDASPPVSSILPVRCPAAARRGGTPRVLSHR